MLAKTGDVAEYRLGFDVIQGSITLFLAIYWLGTAYLATLLPFGGIRG